MPGRSRCGEQPLRRPPLHSSCMDTCTGASFSMADTHLSDYTDGQRSCASTCSLGMCASTLTGGLATTSSMLPPVAQGEMRKWHLAT